ncbi:MATE family efflux transporter, partial [Bacillus cereus]
LYSIALGENKNIHAKSIFSQSMIISVLIVCTLSALALWQIENIAYLFGANPHILPYTLDYLYILFGFGFIYVLENVLSTFIRNDGNPNLAMIGLVVTALLNILLNYLFIFIFHWGVPGSAWATIISAGIGFCVLLSHFLKKDRVLNWASWKLEWPLVKQIMLIGFPSFTAEITVAISTVCFNIAFMQI